jgi:hypothetical protein
MYRHQGPAWLALMYRHQGPAWLALMYRHQGPAWLAVVLHFGRQELAGQWHPSPWLWHRA